MAISKIDFLMHTNIGVQLGFAQEKAAAVSSALESCCPYHVR